MTTATGSLDETLEGLRVTMTGTVAGSGDPLSDGLAIDLDDGSGPARAVIGPDALAGLAIASGDVVVVTGPLGQRDSGGTGTAGYRVYATTAGIPAGRPPDAQPVADTKPDPDPDADPDPTPTRPRLRPPTPTPTPTPTPAPTADASVLSPAAARARSVGEWITVRATVTAEAGRLGCPAAVRDRRPRRGHRHPSAGRRDRRRSAAHSLTVYGQLAAPYGQLELRPKAGGIVLDGAGELPQPTPLGQTGPDEASEGRLVSILGRLLAKPTRSAGGDLTMRFERPDGSKFTVQSDASSGLTQATLQPKATYLVVGIAGQRATRKDALDGYRIWARDRNDLPLQSPAPTPTPSGSASPSASASAAPTLSIAQALRTSGRVVTILATVTAGPTLLDASGRRIVVQDATGAVEVLLPAGSGRVTVGSRLRLQGTVGTAYGAPRLHATAVDRVGTGGTDRPAAPVRGADIGPPVATRDRDRPDRRRPQAGRPMAGRPHRGWRAHPHRRATRCRDPRRADGRRTDGVDHRHRPGGVPIRLGQARRDPAALVGRRAGGPWRFAGRGTQRRIGRGRPRLGLERRRTRRPRQRMPRPCPTSTSSTSRTAHGRLVRVGGVVVDVGVDRFRLDDGTATGTVVLTGSGPRVAGAHRAGRSRQRDRHGGARWSELGRHDRGRGRPDHRRRPDRARRRLGRPDRRRLAPPIRRRGRVPAPGRIRPARHRTGWPRRARIARRVVGQSRWW